MTVVATGFSDKEIASPSVAAPGARMGKSAFARPAPAPAVEKETRGQPFADPNVKSSSPQLNEEELEVPAFMRKPLSK